MKRWRVKLSARAEQDLIDIWFSIAEDSPVIADRFIDKLLERVDGLADFPDRGVLRKEISAGLRMLIEGNYLILYCVNDNVVDVMRIVHGARHIENLF
ncbi:MAG: type II toxin-antitoxin system RelE/ParE family toxin [Hyphomicrobiales bacterium]